MSEPLTTHTVLPQELVDNIIDQLQEDAESLRSCALTHSIWVLRCQRHLFTRYTIHGIAGFLSYPEQLGSRPHLTTHVCHLIVQGSARMSVTDSNEANYARVCSHLLPNLLPTIPNTRTLSIRNVRLLEAHYNGPAFAAAWSRILHTSRVTELQLDELTCTEAPFASLIYAFPHLRVLRITDVNLLRGALAPHVPPGARHRLRLEDLSVRGEWMGRNGFIMQKIFNKSTSPIQSVNKVSFTLTSLNEMPHLVTFLSGGGGDAQTLNLDVQQSFISMAGEILIPSPPPYRNLTSSADAQDFSSIPSIYHPNIEVLSITTETRAEWAALEIAAAMRMPLARTVRLHLSEDHDFDGRVVRDDVQVFRADNFPALECVEISLGSGRHRIHDYLHARLSRVEKLGILHLNVHDVAAHQ